MNERIIRELAKKLGAIVEKKKDKIFVSIDNGMRTTMLNNWRECYCYLIGVENARYLASLPLNPYKN